jgi:hypothetical protein
MAMSFYEKGPVASTTMSYGTGFRAADRRRWLNSTIAGLNSPFAAIDEFKGEYRCIAADLRNANSGQSSGRSRSTGRGCLHR